MECWKSKMSKEISALINENTIFVCFGTMRSIYDSYGPRVGTELRKLGIPCLGTINEPLHALTLKDPFQYPLNFIPSDDIFSIDACIGNSIGKLHLKNYGISPGSGTGKRFDEIGNSSLIATVSDSSEVVWRFAKTKDKTVHDMINKFIYDTVDIIKEACYLNKIFI